MTSRPEEVGDLRLATIVVNALEMDRAASFWSSALGYRAPGMIGPDDQFAKLVDPAGVGPSVLIQRAEEIPSEPAPVHIDLYTGDRDHHIDRLVKLGATRVEDWRYPSDHEFIVLRDTEGNEFCVIAV
jgi:predicted enzyme related to lactoylglutathione lyase